MTCVLALVVEREREIREFKETPFYRIVSDIGADTEFEWKAKEGSKFFDSPLLYAENGFKEQKDANTLKAELDTSPLLKAETVSVKEEKKGAPLLYNLAEIQFECSKKYKISPE